MDWKIIDEFPNYEINELGTIKNKLTGRILSQSLSSHGYMQVNIGNKSRRVHRLLAIAFIDNPFNLETVNHIDGNKLNNTLINLEWLSRTDNVKHSRNVLNKIPIPYSITNKQSHMLGRYGFKANRKIPIKVILKDNTERIFGSIKEACRELFNDHNKSRAVLYALNHSGIYRNIKFERYEKHN